MGHTTISELEIKDEEKLKGTTMKEAQMQCSWEGGEEDWTVTMAVKMK